MAHAIALRLRDKEVAAILGIGTSTLWRWVKERPGFPQPRREGRRCTYWLRPEIESYALGVPASSHEQGAC